MHGIKPLIESKHSGNLLTEGIQSHLKYLWNWNPVCDGIQLQLQSSFIPSVVQSIWNTVEMLFIYSWNLVIYINNLNYNPMKKLKESLNLIQARIQLNLESIQSLNPDQTGHKYDGIHDNFPPELIWLTCGSK